MTNKKPRLRTHTRKGKNGQVWTWWTYDQRPHGPEISLGSDYIKAMEQWDLLHNKKPLTIGRVQQAIDQWRADVLPTYESAETRKGYTKQLARIEAWCGNKAWYEITLPVMRQYLKKRSAKTQGNREMAILSILWSYARMEGMTELQWPAAGVKDWKNPEVEREFEVTDELFNAVYACGDQILKDCMDIATTTGMRLTDARTVRMPVDGKLRFRSSKKGKFSYFEVSESPVLTALLARRGQAECVTLLTTPTGRTVSESMLRTRYDKAREAAAVANPLMEDQIRAMYLRDSRKRAADLAEDMDAASALLQHSSKALTAKHYRTKATKLKAVR
jgi:integrase